MSYNDAKKKYAKIGVDTVYPVILSEAEVEDGIRTGTIFDAKTLSAWACYKMAR